MKIHDEHINTDEMIILDHPVTASGARNSRNKTWRPTPKIARAIEDATHTIHTL
jgi:hypothetical protein